MTLVKSFLASITTSLPVISKDCISVKKLSKMLPISATIAGMEGFI